ncbi:Uncharacterised protein [Serratia marcescens]|nr:Uncharacterised protein [Serratia marcescens]
MKRLSLLTLLTLTAMGAHAADRIDMTSSLQLKMPTCTLSVTPLNSTIAATYTVTQENIDGNTAGTYAFPTATAEYLVSTDEACATLPAFNFAMPTPPTRTGRVDKTVTAGGVDWRTNTYLADLNGHDESNGTGTPRPAVGTVSGTIMDGRGRVAQITRTPVPEDRWTTAVDQTSYAHSANAQVSVNEQFFHNTSNANPIAASSGYGAIATITPALAQTDASMTISIGAMFDAGGPRVGAVYDQGAIVNALDYGWTGTLTVTAL